MQVIIHNLYSGARHSVSGPPDTVKSELQRLYPWLADGGPDDVPSLVEALNDAQAFDAEILDATDLRKAEGNLHSDPNGVVAAMLGYNHQLQQSLAAARFLCAGGELPLQAVRAALYETDGDVDEAALRAYGLEVSDSNRQALDGVKGLQELRKAEAPAGVTGEVEPGHPDAAETAQRVTEAFRDGFVVPVELGGKHSAGSLLARDEADHDTWLLKPGAHGQSPAAGAAQEQASQSRREAAFWHVADAWGMGSSYPRADLLLIDDGKK